MLLLIDEAHNVGDVVQEIQSVECDAGTVDQAGHELAGLRRYQSSAGAVIELLPRIDRFIEGLSASPETMDWFDPALFARMVLRGSLYQTTGQVVDDLTEIRDFVREKSIEAGDFKETAIERLTEFFYRVDRAARDPAFLSVFRRVDEERVALAVRNIDPAPRLTEVAGLHWCTVLISGTLSPVDAYRRYYFEDLPVRTLSLPNAFPRENRLILAAKDVTTAFSQRQSRENADLIADYIAAFATAPGNLAVYFPSYHLLEQFAERAAPRIRSKTVFVEPKEAADAGTALREFLALPGRGKAGVLFAVTGGKWSEGLDYRGEMLSGAMVVGLPLAPFNRVRRMVIDYFVRKFGDEGEFISYTLPAINRALQALGRVLRTPEDRGVLVLAEQRFLEDRVRGGLPPWMQEELAVVDLEGVPGGDRAMALSEGVCRLGAWSVRVVWEGDLVHAVEFCDLPPAGEVPAPIAAYCRGEPVDLSLLRSTALERPGKSAAIYREVCAVPYGMTTTYGTIARLAGTSARAVGQVMRRNPTPLVVPCHRVIGADGSIRGFSPIDRDQGAPARDGAGTKR